jgi:O-methyltransferase
MYGMNAMSLKLPWTKRLAYMLFPRYSLLLDQINYHALFMTWLRAQQDVPAFPSVRALYAAVADYLGAGPIDYLEFGVSAGTSIKRWAVLNTNENSRFFGFDSFEGLPEAWGAGSPKGAYSTQGRIPVVEDSRVTFVKGWFHDTVPGFLATFSTRSRLVVHIDSDLYSSAAYALAKLDPLMKPGTIVIFDEFSSVLHEFRAWMDYQKAFLRSSRCIAVTTLYAQRVAFVLT